MTDDSGSRPKPAARLSATRSQEYSQFCFPMLSAAELDKTMGGAHILDDLRSNGTHPD